MLQINTLEGGIGKMQSGQLESGTVNQVSENADEDGESHRITGLNSSVSNLQSPTAAKNRKSKNQSKEALKSSPLTSQLEVK